MKSFFRNLRALFFGLSFVFLSGCVSTSKYGNLENVDYSYLDSAGETKVSWSGGKPNGKFIALTFDDGPVAANTSRLLEILAEREIKATFYVLGPRVKRNPSLMRQMVADGHELGNHTWTHRNLQKMSDEAVRNELQRTLDAIVEATGVKPRTMRPPYGALSARQRVMIFEEFGYPTILWNVDPEDWKKPGVTAVKNKILATTKDGSIILLHDLHASSVDAVPSTVDALIDQGYQFVTVTQLVALTQENQQPR